MPQPPQWVQNFRNCARSNGDTWAGAEVKATQTATGLVREVATGPHGDYTPSSLKFIGPYRLSKSGKRFKAYVQEGNPVQQQPVITGEGLELGSITQQVEVNANASMVEAQTIPGFQVIDQRR